VWIEIVDAVDFGQKRLGRHSSIPVPNRSQKSW
jgi:hypothetical protein